MKLGGNKTECCCRPFSNATMVFSEPVRMGMVEMHYLFRDDGKNGMSGTAAKPIVDNMHALDIK